MNESNSQIQCYYGRPEYLFEEEEDLRGSLIPFGQSQEIELLPLNESYDGGRFGILSMELMPTTDGELYCDQRQLIYKLKRQKEELKTLVAGHAEAIIESLLLSLIKTLGQCKEMQKRIGIEFDDLENLNAKNVLGRLAKWTEDETELREKFQDFLDSLDEEEVTQDFVWLQSEDDEKIIHIITELALVFKTYNKTRTFFSQEIELNTIMAAQIEIEKLAQVIQMRTWSQQIVNLGINGVIGTKNAIEFSIEAIRYSLEAFKLLSAAATLAGVGALVLQSPYILPIIRIVLTR